MIEIIENGIQMVTTVVCTVIAFHRGLKSHKRAWFMLALASGVYFLGDVYWQLFLVIYGETPHISDIPYLSWYAGYLFLMLMMFEIRGERPSKKRRRILWIIPLFTVGMCIFYLQWGDWVSNIAAAILMSMLIDHAAGGLLAPRENPQKKWIYISILLFCAAEYAAWTISCFWMGDTILNPYFWFDTLLSLSFLLFPWALRKAVDE